MKNLLTIAFGVSVSSIIFVVLLPIIVLILLIKLILKHIDNHA